ncbi:hypothetical protein FRB95_001390 [Tulasnella sp. JGI-2019a]|nr:hypothetical protein FRB95_001390 [Tulasnella sp. JGI-2019a]
MVLFALTGAVHLGQSIYYRIWWIIPTMVFCALGELIGWAGRYWSSKPSAYFALNPFLMQICCTILAPSFMAAGMFFLLGIIVNRIGPEYSRMRPRVFSTIFIACDGLSLVIQAIGGASASIAFQTGKSSLNGTHVMVAGIIFQMFAVTLYLLTGIEFLCRYFLDKPHRPRTTETGQGKTPLGREIRLMLTGLVIATIFLYIRSIYRTIELLGGWEGAIIKNQTMFDCLDGMPIFVALLTLNILNPGWLLFSRNTDRGGQTNRYDDTEDLPKVSNPNSGSATLSDDLKYSERSPSDEKAWRENAL